MSRSSRSSSATPKWRSARWRRRSRTWALASKARLHTSAVCCDVGVRWLWQLSTVVLSVHERRVVLKFEQQIDRHHSRSAPSTQRWSARSGRLARARNLRQRWLRRRKMSPLRKCMRALFVFLPLRTRVQATMIARLHDCVNACPCARVRVACRVRALGFVHLSAFFSMCVCAPVLPPFPGHCLGDLLPLTDLVLTAAIILSGALPTGTCRRSPRRPSSSRSSSISPKPRTTALCASASSQTTRSTKRSCGRSVVCAMRRAWLLHVLYGNGRCLLPLTLMWCMLVAEFALLCFTGEQDD